MSAPVCLGLRYCDVIIVKGSFSWRKDSAISYTVASVYPRVAAVKERGGEVR